MSQQPRKQCKKVIGGINATLSLNHRMAFTLVELLVVIAIIGILVALLLPAIQAARERARMAICANHMMQISMALHRYESGHEHLPAGVTNPTGPIYNAQIGNDISWLAHLLPHLDERNLYDKIDFAAGAYAPVNQLARSMTPPVFICPSAGWNPEMLTNYAGCHNDLEESIDTNNNGVLFLNSKTRLDDVKDGLSYTIFIGEKQTGFRDLNNNSYTNSSVADKDLGWLSGTRATLRNTGTPINKTLNVGTLFTAAWPPNPDPDNWRELIEESESRRLDKIDQAFVKARELKEAEEDNEGNSEESDAFDGSTEQGIVESNTPPEATETDSKAADTDSPDSEETPENNLESMDAESELIAPVGPLDPAWQVKGTATSPNPLLYVGGFGSDHNQGSNFAFGDGSVKVLTPNIDMKVYERLGARNDGELIKADELRD